MNGRTLTLGLVAGLAVAGLARRRSAALNNQGSVNGEALRNDLLPAALRDTHDLVVTDTQKRTSHWEPTGVGNGVTSVPYTYHTLVATLYPRGERWKESRLGQVAATHERRRETPIPLRGRCADDLARLGGPDYAFGVTGAFVDESLRGKGVGQALYAALVEAAGAHGGALTSNRCLTGTELTSADALRVWERLGRRYVVEGEVAWHRKGSAARGSDSVRGSALAQAEAQQNQRQNALEQMERDILLRYGRATTMGAEGRDLPDQLERASIFARIRVNELDIERGRAWVLKLYQPIDTLRDEIVARGGDLYDLRKDAGLDPKTGLPKEGPRNTVENVSEGEYEAALLPTAEFRSNCPDPVILSDDGIIEHAVCRWKKPRDAWHHLRYFVDGKAVAALSLRQNSFPTRGKPNATIDVVYVDPDYRGRGYASMLMDEAKDYFSVVKHSNDLTQAGAAWKATVQNRVKT